MIKMFRPTTASAQLAIVGEVEFDWTREEIDKDFEKLLAADSLVLFMTFQGPVEMARQELDRLEAAVRRQEYTRLRGLSRPACLPAVPLVLGPSWRALRA
jgi:hypothetical protein